MAVFHLVREMFLASSVALMSHSLCRSKLLFYLFSTQPTMNIGSEILWPSLQHHTAPGWSEGIQETQWPWLLPPLPYGVTQTSWHIVLMGGEYFQFGMSFLHIFFSLKNNWPISYGSLPLRKRNVPGLLSDIDLTHSAQSIAFLWVWVHVSLFWIFGIVPRITPSCRVFDDWWFCSGGRWCHLWYTEQGTRFPFWIAKNAKWTDSENNKQGFALDVIFQNVTVCNFYLKRNFLSFFPWSMKFLFYFSWIVKRPFYFPWNMI